MAKVIDYFTGHVNDYDPETDVDEYIVCSAPTKVPGLLQANIGHATYSDFRLAKLCQIRLALKGVNAWIEHIPAMGPPTIEEQLDASRHLDRFAS